MVAEYEVVEDVGLGKGMLSTMQLINAEEYGGKVLLKVPGCEGTRERFLIDDNTFCTLHNTEVAAYTFLERHQEKNISYPKVYELEKMDTTADPIKPGHIIMEYMRDITHMYCTDNLKPEELEDAVKNLARFHSIGADLTEEESKEVVRDFVKSWFTKLFIQSNKDSFIGNWKGELTDLLTSEMAKNTIGKLDGILTPENFEKWNDDCQISGVQEVLCHGDYSFHNLLYQKLPDGSFKFRAIVDFQSVNWGNAAQDLTRLFVTALGGKDRRDSEDRLLKVYHDELTAASGGKAPFTFEQLQQSYARFFQLHGAIVCTVTPGLFLTYLADREDGPEKDAASFKEKISLTLIFDFQFRDKMMEKYQALLEDLNRKHDF
ncbi:Protein CBG11337 [Caenorhabditis briggsae]|uniref:Protein CBG11337 n=1 Tax=Caenorhabditis briggsae TaxID=6238 RepID=A8XD89_CAEBR|nr:Protein CBG11337 [Caenorhabditis briggsae]CAP30608.2 Protein CBG11337 [Caenorhabditis briggsae]